MANENERVERPGGQTKTLRMIAGHELRVENLENAMSVLIGVVKELLTGTASGPGVQHAVGAIREFEERFEANVKHLRKGQKEGETT